MQSKRLSTMFLASAVAAAYAGPLAPIAKAVFVLDVRAVSSTGDAQVLNAKSVIVNGFVPSTVTFQIWGMIQTPYASGNPEDGNPNNEANKVIIGSFLTTGLSVKGNLSATVVPAMQNLGFSTGTIQDLDGDGDLDVGSNVSTTANDYWAARTTDVTNGLQGQSALLGTVTLTVTSVQIAGPNSTFNFRRKTGAANSVASWNENGTTVLSNSSNITSGTDVQLTPGFVPEPATLGLIGIAGLALARRASRRGLQRA